MAHSSDLHNVWPPSLKIRYRRERHPRYWLQRFLIAAAVLAAIVAGRYVLGIMGVV
jgi:hypothetical protein